MVPSELPPEMFCAPNCTSHSAQTPSCSGAAVPWSPGATKRPPQRGWRVRAWRVWRCALLVARERPQLLCGQRWNSNWARVLGRGQPSQQHAGASLTRQAAAHLYPDRLPTLPELTRPPKAAAPPTLYRPAVPTSPEPGCREKPELKAPQRPSPLPM